MLESGYKNSEPVMLTTAEAARYSRHTVLPEVGKTGQLKLKQAKVLIIGAGGLGSPLLYYLTAAGVGTIGIVDHDVVHVTNLQRQILYTTDDVNKSKAYLAAQRLKLLNPHIQFDVYDHALTSQNALNIIHGYDLVVDGSDNFPTRYLINDACVILNKTFVFASIYKFEGQLSVFNYEGGPTYRCLFPEPPANSPNCSEIGVIGVLPGIIGCLQANEVIKIITGIGEILSGKLLILNALNLSFITINIERTVVSDSITKLESDYEGFCGVNNPLINNIREISVAALKKDLAMKANIQLIDVREISEFNKFNINGESIPLSMLENSVNCIKRDRKVVLHCQKGTRSKTAINYLQKVHQFNNLYHLTGGIEAWMKENESENGNT